jgi:hypothetical protein
MVIVSTVLLVQQQKFDSSTVLRSLAYSVALSIRQAQVYGVSVLGTTTPNGVVNYASAYGLYFNSTDTQYILFVDLADNGQYVPGEANEVFTLDNGYIVSKFCATTAGSSPLQRCWYANNSGGSTISSLSIVFQRPNPNACIDTSYSPNACQSGANPPETYSSAYIQLQSTADPANTRSVSVSVTGEISVCAVTGC